MIYFDWESNPWPATQQPIDQQLYQQYRKAIFLLFREHFDIDNNLWFHFCRRHLITDARNRDAKVLRCLIIGTEYGFAWKASKSVFIFKCKRCLSFCNLLNSHLHVLANFFGPLWKIIIMSMTNSAHSGKRERTIVSDFYWLKTPPAPAITLGTRSTVSRLNGTSGPGSMANMDHAVMA